jgi:hypothetical protein
VDGRDDGRDERADVGSPHDNLLPVTIRNIVGRAIMVRVVYWFVIRGRDTIIRAQSHTAGSTSPIKARECSS